MIIRKAQMEDMEVINKLSKELVDYHIDVLKAKVRFNHVDYDELIFKCMLDYGTIVVIEENMKVLGYTMIHCRGERGIHIGELMIDKNCRNRGLGSTLLKEALNISKEHKRVTVSVDHGNTRAIKCYKKLGFKEIINSNKQIKMELNKETI